MIWIEGWKNQIRSKGMQWKKKWKPGAKIPQIGDTATLLVSTLACWEFETKKPMDSQTQLIVISSNNNGFWGLCSDLIIPPVCDETRAGSLLWVYRQYIGRPYIALARQVCQYIAIYQTHSAHFLQHITQCNVAMFF